MSDDIQYWKDSIIREIEEIRVISLAISNESDDLERATAFDSIEEKICKAKGSCRALKAEIRIVANHDENRTYRKELASYEKELSQLSAELKGFESKESRSQLLYGASSRKNVKISTLNDKGVEDPTEAGDVLLDFTERNQDKIEKSLQNTLRTIKNARDTGMATVEEIESQGHQIKNIGKGVVEVEKGLKTADKRLRVFRRRIATDNFIRVFTFVNLVLLIGVVVLFLVL